MKLQMILLSATATLASIGLMAQAETVNSRCDIYPRGEDRASKVVNCTFYQRQGNVTIQRADGVTYELELRGNKYVDQNGNHVSREQDGSTIIFRLPNESVYLYQGESAPSSSENGHTPKNLIGTQPSDLGDLIDARAGQAEQTLIQRGYTYRNIKELDNSKKTYYLENRTGYCVEVKTTDGKYSSILYSPSHNCQ